MMGGFISFMYFSADNVCMMIALASLSGNIFCCFSKKSKSWPLTYSNTVQNLENGLCSSHDQTEIDSRVRINLEHIKQLDNTRMVQFLMNIVLSQCMP